MGEKLPFTAYGGAEPYLFISYAHKDDAKVFSVIRELHAKKYRIWYDEGIEVGANWPQMIAEHLRDSSGMIIFISKNSIASQNCQREINYGVAQRKKSIIVMLDDSEIPPDMGMQLSVGERIKYTDGPETAEKIAALLDDSLIGDGVTGYERTVSKGKKALNKWFVASIIMALLVIGMAVYLIGSLNGWFGSKGAMGVQKQTIESEEYGEVSLTGFSNEMSLGILLNTMDEKYIYICGSNLVSNAAAIERGEDGVWRAAGQELPRGSLEDLGSLKDMDILQLAFVNNELGTLDGIESFKSLTYLDISDNPLDDLAPLSGLHKLDTVRVMYLPNVTDLSPLAGLTSLRQVYVSYDMIEYIQPLVDAGIDVIVRR